MSIPDGTQPSIICYSKSDSQTINTTSFSERRYILSTLYSDPEYKNPIGRYIANQELYYNSEGNPNVGPIQDYYGTFCFNNLGSLNFEDSKYENGSEELYVNSIVFGSGNFFDSKGFKVSINYDYKNYIFKHLIYIAQ
jgi:hypothetical protein